ncbi:DEAD/DEAH box helicase [Methyloversatilis sp.]|uniref:DEAD/DEAH box helicase n=1 Tax=Methyloversatilis sp. TaxID=2569862 RepID=UPI0027331491|nr:DEAD/DEAH box helicase family protein [Methyloversatilis sp.]MDP2868256.1 DEAD/DEAH box helicase family protein [Methyloversatilis sp.]MDP3454738.1 DEAD/DEAH box helicase family protein [Methyloversatilis sp.]MDP3576942.1 DEAD/DEAH box helicase family protein [Methyloversatilis sp.]
MSPFAPKTYQRQVLDSIEAYFKACHELPSPSIAFTATTERLWGRGNVYHPLSGFPADMPYFCLRVPTGGGKTWLAAKGVAQVNTHLLRSEHSVILWLVPSKPIREQTIKALRNRSHPYHAALREAGPVTVLDLEEAKSVTRATLDTSTTVIVATRQAFQVADEECRKVYQSSGALMHHFDTLSLMQRDELLSEGEGPARTTPYSLANVLRLRRPFVIVDEAHNSRTELAFDMLARFRPSGVMELTATPDLERTPSNVLHSVSAAELKAEEMIKLPVVLETEPNWQQCLADAIGRRNALQQLADDERRAGAPYLRPLVLIQSEPRRTGVDTLDFDKVRRELISNHGVPESEIIVATGDERGLEQIDADYPGGIADPACPVKFIITQRALAEGWDCPFAYILVSMASLSSATAVEQLLGRVLRQPDAHHRQAAALNRSYAFVVSRNFAETAGALRDRLVAGAGFERREVSEFVTAARADQARLDLDGHAGRIVVRPVAITLSEKPDLRSVPRPVRDKVSWDSKLNTLTISAPLTEDETDALKASVSSESAAAAIGDAAAISRTTAIEFFQTPAELGERFRVPQLALRVQGTLQLFDDPEVLDYPWDLSRYDAAPTADDLSTLGHGLKVSEGGEIDVDGESGKVISRFLPDLQRDLGLVYRPENWDEVRIATWLCRNLPEPSLTHASKQAFVAAWLTTLLSRDGFTLARANLQKFMIRNLLEARIRALRQQAVGNAFQQALFGDDAASRVAVTDQYAFEFHAQAYAPSRDYDGRFGHFDFRRHFYGRMGDFDSREEFECACWLDIQAQQGCIRFWVRNLVRREGSSFFLQKADGRFYPDFLCRLPDTGEAAGAILAVEYKGADRWAAAADDRLIGDLWAGLSGGRCRFVMVSDRQWDRIAEALS